MKGIYKLYIRSDVDVIILENGPIITIIVVHNLLKNTVQYHSNSI